MTEKTLRSPSRGNSPGLGNKRTSGKWVTPLAVLPLTVALVLSVALVSCFASTAQGDDFSSRDPFFSRLSTSMTSIQDGKPFRDALEAIADEVQLNLWIDRRVDPTSPVFPGPVGPTVAAAIQKIAAQRDCVVMPVANVVLVGRRPWVEATAASLLSLDFGDDAAAVADIKWDLLTTPQDALQTASGDETGTLTPPLPHDMWPATHWQQIDRRVAVALVLAQFDRRPRSTPSLHSLTSEPASGKGVFTRRYSTGPESKTMREAMQSEDRNSKFRVADGWLEASGNVAAHRAAVDAMLAANDLAAMPDPKKTPFTLKQPARATAENALKQFAKTAKRNCLIQANATEACKQMITLEADNYTLYELIEKVAEQAGVVATWQADKIIISLE